MSGGTAEVEETSLREDDDGVSGGELVAVDLWLDFEMLDAGPADEASHVDFVIEMADVSNDGVVLHLAHVCGGDDVVVSSSGDVDVSEGESALQGLDTVAFHGGL